MSPKIIFLPQMINNKFNFSSPVTHWERWSEHVLLIAKTSLVMNNLLRIIAKIFLRMY